MPNYFEQSDILPTTLATYFTWSAGQGFNPPRWRNGTDGGSSRTRFIVKGEFISVPEPSTVLSLLALGILVTATKLRHQCKK